MVKEANCLGSSPFYHFLAIWLSLSFLICKLGTVEEPTPYQDC